MPHQQVDKMNMQQQLADMTAQLSAMQHEHSKLTGKNAVLEKLLASRQCQLDILQDQHQVCPYYCHLSDALASLQSCLRARQLLAEHFLSCRIFYHVLSDPSQDFPVWVVCPFNSLTSAADHL